MKLQTLLGLLLATATLSACGGKKDGNDATMGSDTEQAPSIVETSPPAADIIPPGAVDAATEKAGEMKDNMKKGAEDALDSVKEKAKEAVTN